MQYKSRSGTQGIDKAKHFKIPSTADKTNESLTVGVNWWTKWKFLFPIEIVSLHDVKLFFSSFQ